MENEVVEGTELDASPKNPSDDGADVEVVAVLLNPKVTPEPASTTLIHVNIRKSILRYLSHQQLASKLLSKMFKLQNSQQL